ncbi:MAG: helix-turn-helix domain-containing protein [Lentisphaerae bacterium]|nr:helix-turn-helix domain-containing protein [Lentisphaerota bacterium]
MADGQRAKIASVPNAPERAPTPCGTSRLSGLNHPALRKLDELARQSAGIGLAVVFPHDQGWEQLWLGGDGPGSSYCRLFLRNAEGAKHCKMCHILIAVASCSQGLREQRCHTGVSVLVAPIRQERGEAAAVLSNCVFASGARESAWKETRARGKQLGLDLKTLRKEFLALPEPTAEKKALVHLTLEAAAQMAGCLARQRLLEQELSRLQSHVQGRVSVPSAAERALTTAIKMTHSRKSAAERPSALATDRAAGDNPALRRATARGKDQQISGGKTPPTIVKVVKDLVNRRPDLSFSVTEIAHAARLSPNYFSALFRRHAKERFSDFLVNRRIALAQEYLRDNTLNISEVAFKVGYDDPGYFIRCFKRRVGLTPGTWRNRLS